LARRDYVDIEADDGEMMTKMEDEDEDPVTQSTVLLVGEADLEGTPQPGSRQTAAQRNVTASKAKLSRVISAHVYSLSPSPIRVRLRYGVLRSLLITGPFRTRPFCANRQRQSGRSMLPRPRNRSSHPKLAGW
jgi:hypothetical protein